MKDQTNRSFWNRFAVLYDLIIKKDNFAYDEMYSLIRARVNQDMKVLELATGTGLIALEIADRVGFIEAADFSPRMIEEAKKKAGAAKINFSVHDACQLPYHDESFDCVIISNALHIMPKPELALKNIRRVLKMDGVLIAPNFTHADNDRTGQFKAGLMELFGFRAYHKWTADQYHAFLEENGYHVNKFQVLPAAFPLAYAEASKRY